MGAAATTGLERSPLRVAYAGDVGTERSSDFAAFLDERFAEVAVASVSDLGELDLTGSDVLIVDGEVELTEMWAPQLPARLSLQDFPIPTVLVGSLGGQVGDKLGLKVARALGCVCLKESAVVGRTWGAHPIFGGPFPAPKVEPRVIPTPTAFTRGPGAGEVGTTVAVVDLHSPVSQAAFEGSPELTAAQERGDEQTVRALLRSGSPIGLVSSPVGFLDSPDCEWVLGGINTKAVDYVAVGRHGRFLLWGFGAQPSEMTPIGAALFCNAVAYIARFAGAPCEALRVSQPREWVRSMLDLLPPDAALDAYELALPEPLGTTVTQARERWSAYRGLLRFSGGIARGEWVLDEELQALGVANDDPKLPWLLAEQLDAAGEAGDRARTLWRRYLRRDSSDVEAERAWLGAQGELFFSDWAGYRWISRTDLPRLNPPRLELHSSGVVQALADAHRASDGRISARVRLTVTGGFYVYPPGSTEGVGLSVTTAAGSPYRVVAVPVVAPVDEHLTQATIQLELEGQGDELVLDLRTQACDAQQCLVPTTLEVTCAITSDADADAASATRTLRFPDENPGWTVTLDGEDTALAAKGEVVVPADARLFVQAEGGLDALRGVPPELLTGLTATKVGPGQLGILREFRELTTLFLQGDFTDADVEPLAADVLPRVTFLMLSSSGVTGTCFSKLRPHPELAVSVYGCPLSDEGFAAMLQLPAKRTRTIGVGVLPAAMLEGVSEIAAEDIQLPVHEVDVPALLDLVARSPRLTSFSLVDDQDGTAVLDDEAVRELRRRRPDLTIDGAWLAPEAVGRADSGVELTVPQAPPAQPVEITTANFDELTGGSTPVLVDFTAQWCGPCKQLAPTIHEITGELAGRLVVGTLDIDEQKAIAERFDIMAIPALLVFREGRQVARIGARDKQAMYAELAAVL